MMVEASRKMDMRNIFVIAPTTPESRIPKIVSTASGFLYYVQGRCDYRTKRFGERLGSV